jgi:adenylate cyclase
MKKESRNQSHTIGSKALKMGIGVALVGAIASMTSFGMKLEEEIGLHWLFTLRGERPAPQDVIVVTTDRKSAFDLGVPQEIWKWPRSLHAQLVKELTNRGATAIAFDLFFKEAGVTEEDAQFAEAMRNSGKVVLIEKMTTPSEAPKSPGIIMQMSPTSQLKQAARALAPNPLPSVPFRVNQFWLFEPSSEHFATLPVMAALIHEVHPNNNLWKLVKNITPEILAPSKTPGEISDQQELAVKLRTVVRNTPEVVKPLLEVLAYQRAHNPGFKGKAFDGLLKAIGRGDSQYLDYYGPPQTITTIPYSCVLQACPTEQTLSVDFAGKAVFVGLSEEVKAEQKDRFHTVFTSADGLYLSGVEIAATAFGNLLEDRAIVPLPRWLHLSTVIAWGIFLGFVFRVLPQQPIFRTSTGVALGYTGIALASSALYVGIAYVAFAYYALWISLIIPLLIQLPLAIVGTVFWRYRETNRERQNIHHALQYYVPGPVAEQLSKSIENVATTSELVEGICLSTDAEHYTALAESLDLHDLRAFMNEYFKTVFEPVRKRHGIVSDVVGDAVLAIWAAPALSQEMKQQVCEAALDIIQSVAQFNVAHPDTPLPTRIGLHGGPMLLGNVGSMDHYEYRAIGDIVNTATRIEGVNKQLGTRILGSRQVLENVDGFLTRDLGRFQLVGKSRPIIIYELIGRETEVDSRHHDAVHAFGEGLKAFHNRQWEKAIASFQSYLIVYGHDGPCSYYLEACETFKITPPLHSWEGMMILQKK